MRVLAISHSALLTGGAEQALLEMISNLRNRIHIDVVVPDAGPLQRKLEKLGCKVFVASQVAPGLACRWCRHTSRLSSAAKFELFEIEAVASHLISMISSESEYDLVYTNTSATPLGAMLAAKLGVRHVWHFRECIDSLEWDYILPRELTRKYIEKYSSCIVYTSQALGDRLDFEEVNSYVVYDGPICQNWKSKSDYSVNGIMDIAVIGKLSPNKMQIEAIELMSLIEDLPVRLHLYGNGDIAYVNELHKYCQMQGLKEKVFFHGYVDSRRDIYLENDIVLIPSIWEGFGRVLAEAMAAGLPVIARDAGASSELIFQSAGGLLYQTNEIGDLEKHVRNLHASEDLRRDLGANGKEYANRYFLDSIHADRMAEIFERVGRFDKVDELDVSEIVRQAIDYDLMLSSEYEDAPANMLLDSGREILNVKLEMANEIKMYRASYIGRICNATLKFISIFKFHKDN